MDEVEHFERQLYDWQKKLSGKCTMSLPVEKTMTEEEKTAASIKPVLLVGAAAAALYFFGPTIHKELFAPAVVRRDLMEERRRKAMESGDDEHVIDSKAGALGPDLAAKVSLLLGETAHTAGRAVGDINKLARVAARSVRRGVKHVENWAESVEQGVKGDMRALPAHEKDGHDDEPEEN
jgi:hypothetical protein